MGAFPDDVEHFHRWLTANGYDYRADDFVPRKIFGDISRARSSPGRPYSSADNRDLIRIDEQATDIAVDQGLAQVIFGSGENVDVGTRRCSPSAIFCRRTRAWQTRHFHIGSESIFETRGARRLTNPLKANDSMFIVGTGLSMVDVAMHLTFDGPPRQDHGNIDTRIVAGRSQTRVHLPVV